MEAIARAPNDSLIDTRQRQPFDAMRAQRDASLAVSPHRGDALHQFSKEIAFLQLARCHIVISVVAQRAVPDEPFVPHRLLHANATSAPASSRRPRSSRTA